MSSGANSSPGAPSCKAEAKPDLPTRGVAGDDFSREHGRDLRILLNGQPQERVLAFNCELGWVRRMIVDLDGNIEVDWALGVVRQETIRGKVEVEWRDGRDEAKG
jgi:hypothetical protein